MRVYEPVEAGQAPVVIITELWDNPKSPVLDEAGRFVSEITARDVPALSGRSPVLIQHNHAREGFYLLVFSAAGTDGPGTGLGGPRWKYLDRASVERLVGLPV
ncbi:Hypothetical Protein RradSPS_1813 [Rubrobacter radiotolerans]|uniref:Uncharacterized protein n=1 Tax=Rubrobacter radiotolerans TaxID=42256 RepID=A0A023X4I8_RUBRA|nr:Hypothetical Protein RradSPS_1813 [Rubrobacter radiotolerans]SMC06135.1 hypothetical protein SAMN00767673_1815 [Rubrobacter radiotolerans DSM 5868]